MSVLACLSISRWTAEVSCPIVSLSVWPAYWIDTPDRSSSSVSRAVQDAWDVKREGNLGLYLLMLCLHLGMRFPGLVLMMFGRSGARMLRHDFSLYCKAGGPTAAGSSAFLGRGLLRVRSRRLSGRAVGGRGASRL